MCGSGMYNMCIILFSFNALNDQWITSRYRRITLIFKTKCKLHDFSKNFYFVGENINIAIIITLFLCYQITELSDAIQQQ